MSDKIAYPGPWTWYWRDENGEADCGVTWEARPGAAYSVCRAPRYESREQWEANARLIAAAPDLLDALRELLSAELSECPPYEAGKDAQDAWADKKAKARNDAAYIIAKATGGAA